MNIAPLFADMNIKYRQLKAFTLAYETGSFATAADRLAVTPSSFSALMKDLEDDLGVMLFERTTRRCRATDAGRSFYDRIRGPLEDLELGYGHVREIGRGTRGTLHLGCLPSLASSIVTPQLASFQRHHPEVRIRLRERKHGELIDSVKQGDVEFGIGVLLRPDPELSFEYLSSDRLMFAVPIGHPLTTMAPVWKCLEKYPYIYVAHGDTDHALGIAQVRAPAAYEVEHVATALAMVRQGLGVSVLPSSLLPSLNVRGLRFLPIRGDTATRRLGIIAKKSRPLSAAARAFIALLHRAMASKRPSRDDALRESQPKP